MEQSESTLNQSEVATANIGGDMGADKGMETRFYLSREGYDKMTSITPCANWLMKVIDGDETGNGKSISVMETKAEDVALQFRGAILGSLDLINLVVEYCTTYNYFNMIRH